MEMSIKQIRLSKEIKQQEMADALGIHVQTYRKLENNPENATIAQAKRIAEVLNVPYDNLIFTGLSTLSRMQNKQKGY